MSTPQSGVTLRALTHHLALVSTNEVTPRWLGGNLQEGKKSLNLLVVPWPFTLKRTSFEAVPKAKQTAANLPKNQGQFSVRVEKLAKEDRITIRAIIRAALVEAPWIDIFIFPELAFANEADYEEVSQIILEEIELRKKAKPKNHIFIIAGVAADGNGKTCNQVITSHFMQERKNEWLLERHSQRKHHNWKIDNRQIYSYGLKYRLKPEITWWEKNYLNHRKINFHLAYEWLNFCVVICEDLARPDPAAELIRAIGPNLVIALLMDGPQLTARWPARYATVLADDPGSSVLTVTSLGMAKLCCPHGTQQSREIALWKEWDSTIVPIQLPTDASAVLMHVDCKVQQEWTADGRSDGGVTFKVLLKGVIPVNLT